LKVRKSLHGLKGGVLGKVYMDFRVGRVRKSLHGLKGGVLERVYMDFRVGTVRKSLHGLQGWEGYSYVPVIPSVLTFRS